MKENKNYIWTAFSWDSVRRTDAPFIVDDNNASIHRWIQHENRSRVLTHTSIGYRKWSVAHAHNRFWWPFCCWAVRCASRILHSKKSPPKLVATSLITPPPLPQSGRVPRYVTGRRPLCATADKYLLLPHGSPTRRRQCVRSHLRHANTTRLRCIS